MIRPTLLCLLAAGCAGPGRPPLLLDMVRPAPARVVLVQGSHPATPAPDREARRTVVRQAVAYLEGAPLRAGGLAFEPDPVGFVRAAYWSAGIDLIDADLAGSVKGSGMEL